jgi:hypothetical protein
MGKDPNEIRREIEQTRESIGETADAIAYKADIPSRVRENVYERVDGAKETLRSSVQTIASTVTTTAARAQETVKGAADRTASTVGDAAQEVRLRSGGLMEDPLKLALGAAVLGFIAGSIVPMGSAERRTLSPLRDRIADQVRPSTLIEQAKRTAIAMLRTGNF